MNTRQFIKDSVNVLRAASVGRYEHDSEAVREIRREMMGCTSSLKADRENLARDRRRVAADVRTSFIRITQTKP